MTSSHLYLFLTIQLHFESSSFKLWFWTPIKQLTCTLSWVLKPQNPNPNSEKKGSFLSRTIWGECWIILWRVTLAGSHCRSFLDRMALKIMKSGESERIRVLFTQMRVKRDAVGSRRNSWKKEAYKCKPVYWDAPFTTEARQMCGKKRHGSVVSIAQ